MPNLNLVSARLHDTLSLPAPQTMYEYVVAGNGLFVQAEDDRLLACIPVAAAVCPGLSPLMPEIKLKLPRIPEAYLTSVWHSALRAMPNEAAYQFIYDDGDPVPWRCVKPDQHATPTSVNYSEHPDAAVDLHSHGALTAFFSGTDDHDEGGFRIYCVVGELGAVHPALLVRVGVYGHHWPVPASLVFDGLGPFTDAFEKEIDL